MKRALMIRTWQVAAVLAFGGVWIWSERSPAAAPYDPVASERGLCERRPVDLVICLDTSGSMTGLIDSARARLWDIVTSLSRARPTPRLRVGLLTYGAPSRSTASQGWVAFQSPLTTDLDSLYSKMMSLGTDGGDEFVGWVLHDALHRMDWSNDPRALKIIFVAGNESADQASEVYNFRHVAETARGRGIVINSIFAGDRRQGVSEHWDQVAACGGGSYSAIDMQCGTVQIDTPHDKVLLELNMKLNATYVPYGDAGREGAANQEAQDENALRLGRQSAGTRVAAKATVQYDNARWDLVDAVAQSRVKVEELKAADLPEPMRDMDLIERRQFVETQRTVRAKIQKRISEVNGEREKFVKESRQQKSGGKVALDDAMLETLRTQAKEKGFTFE